MGSSATTTSWLTPEIATEYFGYVTEGMGHEGAAEALRQKHAPLIGHLSLGTITRAMRGFRQRLEQLASAIFDDPMDGAECAEAADGGDLNLRAPDLPDEPDPLALANAYAANVASHATGRTWHGNQIDRVLQEAVIRDERLRMPFKGLVPPPLAPTAFEPLVLPYRDCLLWCDVHVPYHLNEAMAASLRSAVSNNLRRIIIAGDFMDTHWGSKFISWKTKAVHHESIREEFAIAQAIFAILLDTFEEVIIIPGNHDGGRWQRFTNGAVDFELLCSFMGGWKVDEKPDKLTIGMNRSLVLEGSPWGDWRITHPRKARKVPLSLAEELAAKYGMNILTAHQHHLGSRMHRHLPYICCDGGHLQDASITDYKQEVDDAHANWVAGWVELVDGWPTCRAWRPRADA